MSGFPIAHLYGDEKRQGQSYCRLRAWQQLCIPGNILSMLPVVPACGVYLSNT